MQADSPVKGHPVIHGRLVAGLAVGKGPAFQNTVSLLVGKKENSRRRKPVPGHLSGDKRRIQNHFVIFVIVEMLLCQIYLNVIFPKAVILLPHLLAGIYRFPGGGFLLIQQLFQCLALFLFVNLPAIITALHGHIQPGSGMKLPVLAFCIHFLCQFFHKLLQFFVKLFIIPGIISLLISHQPCFQLFSIQNLFFSVGKLIGDSNFYQIIELIPLTNQRIIILPHLRFLINSGILRRKRFAAGLHRFFGGLIQFLRKNHRALFLRLDYKFIIPEYHKGILRLYLFLLLHLRKLIQLFLQLLLIKGYMFLHLILFRRKIAFDPQKGILCLHQFIFTAIADIPVVDFPSRNFLRLIFPECNLQLIILHLFPYLLCGLLCGQTAAVDSIDYGSFKKPVSVLPRLISIKTQAQHHGATHCTHCYPKSNAVFLLFFHILTPIFQAFLKALLRLL